MCSRVEKARLRSAPMQKLVNTMLSVLLTVASAALSAAPVGYSINSDSGTSEPDSLYQIDLATGQVVQRVGIVYLTSLPDGRRMDVEGLAIAPEGFLYGIDDETLKLFRINPETALVDSAHDYFVTGGGLTPRDNDFGMTFDCDGNLFVTSVAQKSLYRVDPGNGAASLVGPLGLGDIKVSALAAYGRPTRLFALSNGTAGVGAFGTPSLYQIDPATGAATLIGPLGNGMGSYSEGGLAFDDAGQLWAITDRTYDLKSSQVMRINTSTGAASDIRDTSEQGFESLAISEPGGCVPQSGGENAALFVVQKRFEDGNDITPVKLNISCNGGLPLENSLTVLPDPGEFGNYEVAFVVEDFTDGALSCQVWEETPAGYSAEYDCQSQTQCTTQGGNGPCTFEGVGFDQEDLCLIQNRVEPVEVAVSAEWLFNQQDLVVDEQTTIELKCSDVYGGDGQPNGSGQMTWSWVFDHNSGAQTANVLPDFSGKTQCGTSELVTPSSGVETTSTCRPPVSIAPGDPGLACVVTNTVFFEGIPTLSPLGLVLVSALMVLTGLVAVRRNA